MVGRLGPGGFGWIHWAGDNLGRGFTSHAVSGVFQNRRELSETLEARDFYFIADAGGAAMGRADQHAASGILDVEPLPWFGEGHDAFDEDAMAGLGVG